MNYKFNSKTYLIGQFSHFYNQNNRDNHLQGIDSLFDLNALAVGQIRSMTEHLSNVDLDFYHKYEKSRFGIKAKYSQQEQSLDINTTVLSPSNYTGNNLLNTQTVTFSPYWTFKNDHWYVNANLHFDQYFFDLDNEKVATSRLNPSLAVRYNLSKWHFFLFRMSNKNQLLGIEQATDITQIQDGQTLRLGGLAPQNLPLAQTYSLGYTNFNFGSKRLINITVSTVRQTDITATQIANEPTFVKIQSVIQPYQNNVRGNFLFKQRISKSWKLETKMNYQYLESTILNNTTRAEWTYQTLTAEASVRSNTKKVVNYDLGVIWGNQQQVFGETGGQSQALSSIRPKANLTFHKDSWTLKSKFQYFFFMNNNAPQPIPNWNVELTYAPKSKPFSLSIIGNNILGFNPPEQIQLLLNPVFVEMQIFDMFSGLILAQVKYNFRQD